MDCNTFAALAAFRQNIYANFGNGRDALFDACDALLTETQARSLVELSLSPLFTRRWASLYQAVQNAKIDREALQRTFVCAAPMPPPGKRFVLGIDASSIARPQSKTARDRTYVHASNLPEGSVPVTPGWQFSTLTVLPEQPSSWTHILDNTRIPSEQTQAQAAAAQLTSLAPQLLWRPLLLGDGYYGGAGFLQQIQDVACDALLRLAKNRVLYRVAPPKNGGRGAPRKDGLRFQPGDAATRGEPDAVWSGTDRKGKPVTVSVWRDLHFKAARQMTVRVFGVQRPQADDSKRDPRQSWFVFRGQDAPALSEVSDLYALRFSQEHGYRVDKQALLWETPRLRTPEQFQCWTDLVACVRNQLGLARFLGPVMRQPWERESRERTPPQVRRAMRGIIAQLGTPARLPQLRGKSPGRRAGTKIAPAPRYKPVYKATCPVAKKV